MPKSHPLTHGAELPFPISPLRDPCPTVYAVTNDSEGFAESFMLYCLRDRTLSARSVQYFDALKARLVKASASDSISEQ